jgi:hypothetical protein
MKLNNDNSPNKEIECDGLTKREKKERKRESCGKNCIW